MKKMMFALVLALAVSACGAAVAEQGVAYGVYNLGNEQPDSLIRVTLDCDGEKVTGAQIDEKLIPYSASGAEGWAELDDETAAKKRRRRRNERAKNDVVLDESFRVLMDLIRLNGSAEVPEPKGWW